MQVYTIGFTKRQAGDFFGSIRAAGIQLLLDVRLRNSSQLAGYTKVNDLPFFLREICSAEYLHEPLLAPSPDLLDSYRKRRIGWPEYERRFVELLTERQVETRIDQALFNRRVVLLCSELTAERCHRRVVLEYLATRWGDLSAVHL